VQNRLIITLQLTADVNQRTTDNYIDNTAEQQATHETTLTRRLAIRTKLDFIEAEARLNNI
jgi:hypothetical protein